MSTNYVLLKPTLIDLEIPRGTTGRKRKQRERLNEMGALLCVCDSLNSTYNLAMKVEREIRSGFSAAQTVVTNWYIAQTSADSFEVRVRHFFNLFNSQAADTGVLVDYVSP